MNGNKSKRRNVRQQGHDLLEEMFMRGKGRSKHRDKRIKATRNKIYTSDTIKIYRRGWNNLCDYIQVQLTRNQTTMPRSLDACIPYVPLWLEHLKRQPGRGGDTMSAWTIRAYFSGVAKVLDLRAKDYDLPSRNREDIRRSRLDTATELSADKYADLFCFQRCVGCRNNKELQQLRGTDLRQNSDGTYSIYIRQGKGGLPRYVPVIGTPKEVALVVNRMQQAGDDLVWPHVPSRFDAHAERAYYASRYYLMIARDPMTLPRKDRIYCKGGMRGTVLDRAAVMAVSNALGHFRVEIITGNYLWRLEEAQSDPAVLLARQAGA